MCLSIGSAEHSLIPFLPSSLTPHTGAGNHLSFVLFLLCQSLHLSLALLLLLLLGLPTFLSHYNFDRGLFGLLGGLSQNLLLAAPQAILEQPLPSLLFLLVAFLWCVSHAALFAQLKVVCSNLLTVEARGGGGKFPYLVGGKNPLDQGCNDELKEGEEGWLLRLDGGDCSAKSGSGPRARQRFLR